MQNLSSRVEEFKSQARGFDDSFEVAGLVQNSRFKNSLIFGGRWGGGLGLSECAGWAVGLLR